MNNSTLAGVLGQMACYTGKPITWEEVFEVGILQYRPTPDEANFDTKPPTNPDATGNYPLPMPGVTPIQLSSNIIPSAKEIENETKLGVHTDNWRPLSVGFEAACERPPSRA